jgi:imidazolonepropionase-like amidohydrolase
MRTVLLAITATAVPIVISDVAIVDPQRSAIRSRVNVLIQNGLISDLLAAEDRVLPDRALIVDGRGRYLMPGLWDMHWHSFSESTMRQSFLPLAIAHGVTSVRDMAADCLTDCGSYPDIFSIRRWRDEIAAGTLVGPNMVLASALVDGPQPAHSGSVAVSTADEARQAVAMLHQRGAEFIKVYSLLPREAYFAIAAETKRRGIGFAGHVPDAVTLREAARAGQRSNEHLTHVLLECAQDEARLRNELLALATVETRDQDEAWTRFERNSRAAVLATYSQEKANSLFSDLAQLGFWQCPTLTERRSSAYFDRRQDLRDPRLAFIPDRLRTIWRQSRELVMGFNRRADRAAAHALFRRELDVVGRLHRAGVGLLAGTDVGVEYIYPGFSLHDELELLVEAGLSPAEALQTATVNPARFLGLTDSIGRIERGQRADLVLLDANPLTRIRNTRRIAGVVAAGRWFSREALDRLTLDARLSKRFPGPKRSD